MKKILLLLTYLFLFINCYSEVAQDISIPYIDLMQIKVINQTDNSINFYYNNYYNSIKIGYEDSYTTKQIPVIYEGGNFFIILEVNNNKSIYSFNDVDHWFNMVHQFHIAVFDKGIEVIQAPVDQIFDYSDLSIYSSYAKNRWLKYNLDEYYKTVVIKNSTAFDISVSLDDAYAKHKSFYLQPGEEASYRDNQVLLKFKPIEVYQHSSHMYDYQYDYLIFYVQDKPYEYDEIVIIFKQNGYEVIYK